MNWLRKLFPHHHDYTDIVPAFADFKGYRRQRYYCSCGAINPFYKNKKGTK